MATKPYPFEVCKKCCPTGGTTGGGDITIDTEMSDTSENAVQNKVIKAYVDEITGDIETVLDELHSYAQALINGGGA